MLTNDGFQKQLRTLIRCVLNEEDGSWRLSNVSEEFLERKFMVAGGNLSMDHSAGFRFASHTAETSMASPPEDASKSTPEPVPMRLHINGVNHAMNSEQQVRPNQVRHRECLKNHAASMGGHALDGCGEFLPSGQDGTEEALTCVACSCHRNFHRREVEGEQSVCKSNLHSLLARPSFLPFPPHMVLPLNSPLPEPSDKVPYLHSSSSNSRKKRFRTKFTPEQKKAMVFFADTVGWKISKQEEDAVQRFCDDVGVDRTVLKMWMHNNKNMAKKQ